MLRPLDIGSHINRDREGPRGLPLPHHRTYGSRIRRFGGWRQGETSPQPEPRFPACQRRVHPRCRGRAQHLAGCHLTAPRQATPPLHRSGLRPTRVAAPPLCGPAFRPWGASRASPAPGLRCPLLTSAGRSGRIPPPSVLARTPRDLPRSAVIPSVHRRRIYQARPSCGWRTLRSRARSSRRYHTSYPVRVPRPAPSFHAPFRPHLTVTPWRFPCPSAPRIPGRGTFTPQHDRMHGTHACVQVRPPTRSGPDVTCNAL